MSTRKTAWNLDLITTFYIKYAYSPKTQVQAFWLIALGLSVLDIMVHGLSRNNLSGRPWALSRKVLSLII